LRIFCTLEVFSSIIMRWAGHVVRMRERIYAYRVFGGKPEGRRPFGRPRLRWRVILQWIFENWNGAWTGFIWLRIGTGGRLL
jgi:hypothetical protein